MSDVLTEILIEYFGIHDEDSAPAVALYLARSLATRGLVLVPSEATDKMLHEANEAFLRMDHIKKVPGGLFRTTWAAMVEAAP